MACKYQKNNLKKLSKTIPEEPQTLELLVIDVKSTVLNAQRAKGNH